MIDLMYLTLDNFKKTRGENKQRTLFETVLGIASDKGHSSKYPT